MAKAIINKHIESVDGVDLANLFDIDIEKNKGEIVICNDPSNPTIYIMDSDGSPRKIASNSGSTGESYDDTELRNLISKNTEEIAKNTKEIEENKQAIENLGDIDVNATIPEDIVVAGLEEGQFGSGNYKNGDVITANTQIYTILKNILCKELYPTSVTAKSASVVSTMNNLTLTLSHSDIVEVGTPVRLIEGKTNGGNVSVLQNSQITGMTYGYSSENDNTKDSSDTSIVNNCHTELNDNNYTISVYINNGFNANGDPNIPNTKEGEGDAVLEEEHIGCVAEGSNKIRISATGATYSYSADKINKVYYCSNLGKTDETHYNDGVAEVSGVTAQPTKTATAEITGAFYYFLGYSSNTAYDQFDSDSIRNLTTKNDWINSENNTIIVGSEIMVSNGQSIIIACPSTYELKSINYSNQANMMSKFSSVGEVDVKTGEINTKYKVYVYPITNNTQVEFTNVSIGKA